MEILNYNGQTIKISRGFLPARIAKKYLAPGELFFDYEDDLLYIGLKDGETKEECLLIGGKNSVIWQGLIYGSELPSNPRPGGLYQTTQVIIDRDLGMTIEKDSFVLFIVSPEGRGQWYNISKGSNQGGSGGSSIIVDQSTLFASKIFCSIENGVGSFSDSFNQDFVNVDTERDTLTVEDTTFFITKGRMLYIRNF